MTYDSTLDTLAHIRRVQQLLSEFAIELIERGVVHDESKFSSEEKPHFDEWTPKLAAMTYGSPEYRAALESLRPALDHHNKLNRHHPEHFENGIAGMNLLDFVEMFFDWRASSERHPTGNIIRSITVGLDRFKMEPALALLMLNQALWLKWITHEQHEDAAAGLFAMDHARAAEAAQGILDYADQNLVKFDAVDEVPVGARELFDTAKRLCGLLTKK